MYVPMQILKDIYFVSVCQINLFFYGSAEYFDYCIFIY